MTIHPFDDGNGRIARAIADLALARSERSDYYEMLERTQKGTLDVTPWMAWCLACLGRAIEGAHTTLSAVLHKARFWQAVRDLPINDRQRLVLNRLLDGFEGTLTTSTWAAITRCSSDTAGARAMLSRRSHSDRARPAYRRHHTDQGRTSGGRRARADGGRGLITFHRGRQRVPREPLILVLCPVVPDGLLRGLRHEYLRDIHGSLDEVLDLIRRLRTDNADAEAMGELRRAFHNLAGSSALFGFSDASRRAKAAEEHCVTGTATGPPSAADLTVWTRVIEDLRIEFVAAAADTPIDRANPSCSPRFTVLAAGSPGSVAWVLNCALSTDKFDVRTATDYAAARAALTVQVPHALIVDVGLPGGLAYELVEYVRGRSEGDHTAIVMTSPVTGLLDKVEAIRAGVDAVFEKPFNEAALIARLEWLLSRHFAEPQRILSVEDDPAYAAYLQRLLTEAGYSIRTCAEPHALEDTLAAFKPDLILMDVLLPSATGYDLGRFLRQHETYATVPVLFLTAQHEPQDRQKGIASGADDYLLKSDPPDLVLTTIAARLERARLLKGLLERDGLTGLLTHEAFIARATALMEHCERAGRPAVLVIIDIDHFKDVNDRYGHQAGDAVLAALGALLRRRLRPTDIIGRYGGEEFGLVIQDVDRNDGVRLVARLLEEFRSIAHAVRGGTAIHVSFSAGVAELSDTRRTLGTWVAEADAAMYAAKRGGRDRVSCA